jgi:hypothetical protein
MPCLWPWQQREFDVERIGSWRRRLSWEFESAHHGHGLACGVGDPKVVSWFAACCASRDHDEPKSCHEVSAGLVKEICHGRLIAGHGSSHQRRCLPPTRAKCPHLSVGNPYTALNSLAGLARKPGSQPSSRLPLIGKSERASTRPDAVVCGYAALSARQRRLRIRYRSSEIALPHNAGSSSWWIVASWR